MLSWLRKTFTSSIGKKLLMAATGLALIGFLIAHLSGNLLLYRDRDGTAFGSYAEMLERNPLLIVAELGLLALFAAHIYLGLRVALENRDARRARYAIRGSVGRNLPGARTMLVTGLIVLVFLAIHVWDFRLQKESAHDLARMVRERLSSPVGGAIYLAGVAALTLHLSHAFQSALQTLGVNHPKYTPLIARIGFGLALVLGLGFASFPVVYLWLGR
jgi:succinate dehydrogenase / fumarate reductase cytochrome b subunit